MDSWITNPYIGVERCVKLGCKGKWMVSMKLEVDVDLMVETIKQFWYGVLIGLCVSKESIKGGI